MRTIIILVFLLAGLPGYAQKKLALLVAVGQYPPNSGCPPIAALNDIKYIKTALIKHQFEEKNIDTLKNEEATKANILKHLDALARKARKDDIVLVHFGCHGQQIQDQHTVELGKDEADGYDEALLPYDARGRYDPRHYRGQNHLRDDELGKKLSAIRDSLGPNGSLLVLIDACHSGTATRADAMTVARGEPVPFPDPEHDVNPEVHLARSYEEDFFGEQATSRSNMVVISGSGPHQKNFQTRVGDEQVGSLSYAFSRAMLSLPPQADYEYLFYKIKALVQAVHPAQQPLIEGRTNQHVFSGNYAPKQERVVLKQGVRELQFGGDTVFSIDQGLLHNIGPGVLCKIYPLNESVPVAEGKIIRSGNFSSIGISNKPLARTEAYEVKPDELNYGMFRASIKTNKPPGENQSLVSLDQRVRQFLKSYPYLSIEKDADLMIDYGIDKNNSSAYVELVDLSGSVLWNKNLGEELTVSDADLAELHRAVKNYMRVRYLRSLNDGGELGKKLSAWIVPFDTSASTKPELRLRPGDRFSLRIKNNSDNSLYYSVLSIMPNNTAKVLLPHPALSDSEYIQVKAKQEVNIPLFEVSADVGSGTDLLKIIFSKESMQLRDIFDGKSTRSNTLSFEDALKEMYKEDKPGNTTRSDISNVKVEEIGILTVGYTIVK